MKRMTNVFFFVFFVQTVLSQWNYLSVQHPQQPWRSGQGTIEQAVISLRQNGSYLQQDLYLTLSGKNLGFYSTDSVEIQMEFSLPKAAIVHDLWLWIDDTTIMKGLILDKWTASNIYEDIVKRRRDPALLLKNSDTQYSLRIYPMAGQSFRKIKVTYSVPSKITSQSIQSELPSHFLRISKTPLNKVTVLFWSDSLSSQPAFVEFGNGFQAQPRLDVKSGQYYFYGEIPNSALAGMVTFSTKNLFPSVFVGKYEKNNPANEGYFHVAFTPARIFNIEKAHKTVLLLEFDESHSAYSTISLVNSLKNFLLENFSMRDSFAVILSGSTITRLKQKGWFPGDSSTIVNTFNSITQNLLQNSNNLQALISDGIDFVKNNGSEGSLWLIAGSDKYHSSTIANPAISSLTDLNPQRIPIHITDVSNYYVTFSYFNSSLYYGNDYFYQNLTRITGGTLTSYRQGSSLQSNLETVLNQIRGTIKSFDMITRIENGFCSNRYSSDLLSTGEIMLDKTIFQVGKYYGQFPFIIELAGIYNGKTITKKIVVSDSESVDMENVAETIWAGNYLSSLEALPHTNAGVKTMIEASLNYRVLSRYTAFLALEPNDTLKACTTCRDETQLVYVEEQPKAMIPGRDSVLAAYPNPFNPETKLRVLLPENTDKKSNTLHIYNMLGQVVKTFDITHIANNRYTELLWNGTNDHGSKVASGVYVAVLSTTLKKYSIKLMLAK